MARGSSFWEWYARVNDDVRHELIDKAWFGQQGRDDAMTRDVHRMAQDAEKREAQAVSQESASDVMREFYGRHHRHAGQDAPAQEQQRDDGMERFYGRE